MIKNMRKREYPLRRIISLTFWTLLYLSWIVNKDLTEPFRILIYIFILFCSENINKRILAGETQLK